MKITINIDANTNEVSVSKGADYDIDLHRSPILYAVITSCDESSYLEGIFASLNEAKECQKKADIQNEKEFGCYATTAIWEQVPGEKCKYIEANRHRDEEAL